MESDIVNVPHTRPFIAKRNHSSSHLPKKVALLYTDAKRKYYVTEAQYITEKDGKDEAASFIPFLTKMGISAELIPSDSDVANRLRKYKPDLVIDLVDSVRGCEYLAATAPATLELLEIPYTGAGIIGLTICYNKYMTKQILSHHGIPVPKCQLFTSWRQSLNTDISYPLILKLNESHGSLEITKDAIVENEKQLKRQLHFLMRTYDQDVLAEEFIEGREIAAFLFHSYNKKVYLIEKTLSSIKNHKFKIIDFDTAWTNQDVKSSYVGKFTKYRDPLLSELVKKAFAAIEMEDYGKFDIRIDNAGRYFFIDSNPNCYFAPPGMLSELTTTMKMYGVAFPILLKRLLQNTMREWGF